MIKELLVVVIVLRAMLLNAQQIFYHIRLINGQFFFYISNQ